ncbi:hypothetical protein TWF730_005883 [Orbilia blumenaviensis]|uniref:3CxxC-type domain-containing protein n=1 Tax=Orbilia blumenaviensis TaxID=1796055 RepID=A0AAV9VL17_9PEZI
MGKAVLNSLKISDCTRSQRPQIDRERCQRSAAKKAVARSNEIALRETPLASSGLHNTVLVGVSVVIAKRSVSTDGKPENARAPPSSWYLFPEHHDLVAEQTPGVHFRGLDEDGVYQWETNLKGNFECSRKGCKNQWQSGVVSTIIRKYLLPEDGLAYNAKVFNQRCIKCKSLGYMKIDRDAYLQRVIRRLKIWRKEKVGPAPLSFRKTGSHKRELCEGCSKGHCKVNDEKD